MKKKDISATVNQLDMSNNVDLPDVSRLSKWKKNFDETAENGATSKFVRELERIGRKLKLPMINASVYKTDGKKMLILKKIWNFLEFFFEILNRKN